MNKAIGIAVAFMLIAPLFASAHSFSGTWTKDVSCVVTPVGGNGMVYGSSPLAPGWNVNLADGGQGGTSSYVKYNGTTCVFNQGCMIPN